MSGCINDTEGCYFCESKGCAITTMCTPLGDQTCSEVSFFRYCIGDPNGNTVEINVAPYVTRISIISNIHTYCLQVYACSSVGPKCREFLCRDPTGICENFGISSVQPIAILLLLCLCIVFGMTAPISMSDDTL
jgi:hypothetical protein